MAVRRRQFHASKSNIDSDSKWHKSEGDITKPFYYVSRLMCKVNQTFPSYTLNLTAFLIALMGGFYFVAYIHDYYTDSTVIVGFDELVTRHFESVDCSDSYDSRFAQCSPKKCGRCVVDEEFSAHEISQLTNIALKGMKFGGSSGGATILDLNSGALSKEDKFVNVYMLKDKPFTKDDFHVYTKIKNKIQKIIANEFGIPVQSIYLTKPTFFSRMTSKPAKTLHDEYWHPHIDKVTYGSFDYTSLLYLSDYGVEFEGGRFMFMDQANNRSIEPKKGRLSFFTSGSENKHFVERVSAGTRYALTVSFTCDPSAAIHDPLLNK